MSPEDRALYAAAEALASGRFIIRNSDCGIWMIRAAEIVQLLVPTGTLAAEAIRVKLLYGSAHIRPAVIRSHLAVQRRQWKKYAKAQ